MRYRWLAFVLPLGLLAATAAAQTTPGAAPGPAPGSSPPPAGYVTQEQFDQAQKAWQSKLDAIQSQLDAVMKGAKDDHEVKEQERAQEMADIEKMIQETNDKATAAQPGLRKLVIAGDASVSFAAVRGMPSTFGAEFSPLFLYSFDERILFEGGFDVGVSNSPQGTPPFGPDNPEASVGGSTSFDLTLADVAVSLCDYAIVGGGVFVVPFGVYHSHYDPAWINKLPDDPLPFGDSGIAPGSSLGLFVRGAVPIESTKLTYDAYVINGPNLVTVPTSDHNQGDLVFDDFTDSHNAKSVGGRIGFQPWAWMEMGYSVLYGDAAPVGTPSVNAFLQAFDFEVKREVGFLKGTVDFHTDWVWSHVGEATYFDATGAAILGPTTISRQGGYIQLSYRPSFGDKFFEKFEPVVRYDWLTSPLEVPGADHEQRWSIGLDYWLRSNVVIKVAYEFDRRQVGDDEDALLVQIGFGF
jgi:hypothetical protein